MMDREQIVSAQARRLPSGKMERDPVRRARAEVIKATTDIEWSSRPGGKLEKPGRTEGYKLVISKAPEFIIDTDGEIVGIDAWVQLFEPRGRELPIDPHRRIINPPTVPRSGIRVVGEDEDGNPIRELTPDPLAAFWEAVQDSIESTPNEAGWRTRGTVTTVFATIADGYIVSNDAVYTNARAGTGASLTVTTTDEFGLLVANMGFSGTTYSCRETFVSFDTSAIADSDVISSIVLDLALKFDQSAVDFTVEARDFDWGASLTTADWVAGADLGNHTLVASIATSGIGAVDSYKTLTSESAFLTVTNIKTGVVRLLLNSSGHRTGVVPDLSTTVQIVWYDAGNAGTTLDPKITITHAAGGGSPTFFRSTPNRIWRLG